MKTFWIALSIFTFFNMLFSQSGSIYRHSEIMSGNEVRTVFGNWGVIGQPSTGGPRGAWKYDTNDYIGDFTMMIGARIPYSDGLNFASVEDCPVIRPSTGGLDENPFTGQRWAFEPYRLDPTHLAMSNDPSTWPFGWLSWPFNTDAILESYFEMDDNNDEEFNYSQYNMWGVQFKPDSTDTTRSGLALKIKTRYRQFEGGSLEDMLLLEYNLINEGTTIYRQMVFGGLMGTYVGLSGNDHSPQEYDDDASFFDIENKYAFFWDWPMDNSRNPFWLGTPGFAAVVLLQSPGNPYDGIDNDRDNATNPGSSAPYFTSTDFNGHTIQAGEQIILIDENYNRNPLTVPSTQFTITTCGKSFTITPGSTFVREGNPGNFNGYDGIDNDFDGLIDENFLLHFNFDTQNLVDPIEIDNTLGPTQYINYFTGQGLGDSLIDENGDDVDEIGLASFHYFVPAGAMALSDDEELMQQLTPGYFELPTSYSNGFILNGEDGDFILGSGMFTIQPGDSQKIILGLVYADTPYELRSKVQVFNASNFVVQANPNLTSTSLPSGVYTGNSIPLTWESQYPGGTVIVEYSNNNGANWLLFDNVVATQSSLDWDISSIPDGIFYKVRMRHSQKPTEIVTSNRFTINHLGQANPQVLFTQVPEIGQVVSNSLEISWLAGDADADNITVSLFYNTEGPDTNWEFLANIPADSGSYLINTRQLVNSQNAMLKLVASNAQGMGEAISPKFKISNAYPILPDSLIAHISGFGNGLFQVHIVDSTKITGHQYSVTFDDSGPEKKYSVKDLDINQFVLTNITQLDSSAQGPEFNGVRLLIYDPKKTGLDTANTGWSRDSITLSYQSNFSAVIFPGIGSVAPTAFPYDYQIEFYDYVVDTTLDYFRNYQIPFQYETYFKVKNMVSDTTYIGFLWIPWGTPGTTVGWHDRIYFIEIDSDGIEQLSWPIAFTGDGTILPQPGDTLFLATIKPFTSADQFIFTTGNVLIGIEEQNILPQKFFLYPNFPNPFNPVTHIRYSVAQYIKIKIEVFNILGQKVKTLIDKKLGSGQYEITWNGTNEAGNRVGSGIYFYRIKAGTYVQTKKMLLLK